VSLSKQFLISTFSADFHFPRRVFCAHWRSAMELG
jgi:hypothetical protein